MKGIKLLLAVCLAPLTFWGATADDNVDAARAAVRRAPNSTVTVTRQKSSTTATKESSANTSSSISRSTNLSVKSGANTTERDRAAATSRTDAGATQAPENTRPQSVVSRQATTTTRTRTASQPIQPRTGATITPSRDTAARATSTPRVANTARTASTRAALSRTATRTTARVADTDSMAATRAEIMSHDAKNCREVYYSCMDEFCANKDAVLKRCACSSRIHEFDSVKKNLADVEDKMLSFNQRLLTVNMDKEDAAALYTATEGELAFNQKDTSQSKKMLDEIAKKLNTSFNDSNFDRSLSPISLSLDMDAAFDSIDSLQGAATTAKNGTELYSAALPICREMAREVCTDDDLTIAESGYQMVIAQDCNTVAKSYQTQTDQARERVREGGALLDMSRLDIYQKRNSDDILTCKSKMLDMLTDSSVCGSDMGKCLDVTGKYIDPSTGQAFLTSNLVQINNLITRPTGDQTWTTAPGNNVFVSYLNSKKKFLAPAMENCQDIADTVWDAFLDDALSQIKLAQESKLEDMRQSCTALTTKCLSETAKSLSDFDARALSIFGVKADKTVNAMCADVTNACNALLENQSDTGSGTGGGNDWVGGMTEIANANTYETILSTCREVGRACIIQVCTSISGNFGLCESIQSSINRKSIINRTACWDEVKNCIKEAGKDKIDEIMTQLGKTTKDKHKQLTRPRPLPFEVSYRAANEVYKLTTIENDFYDEVYPTPNTRADTQPANDALYVAKPNKDTDDTVCTIDPDGVSLNPTGTVNCIYDICDECTTDENGKIDEYACKVCRIAEQIWGNCEANPRLQLIKKEAHNKILQPKDDQTTLLWWFAKNTGTSDESDSCRDTTCPFGYTTVRTAPDSTVWTCATDGFDITQTVCGVSSYKVTPSVPNCCPVKYDEYKDAFENCPKAATKNQMKTTSPHFNGIKDKVIDNKTLYLPSTHTVVATWNLASDTTDNGKTYPKGDYALICAGQNNTGAADTDTDNEYPVGKTITCNGTFVVVNLDTGLYFTPGDSDATTNFIEYADESRTSCYYSLTQGAWYKTDNTGQCPITAPDHWRIDINYEN